MASTASLVLVAIFAVFSVSSASLSDDYNHFVALDVAEKIKLYWSIDKSTESVSFALEAATTGWVGFGISSGTGRMKGADLVIGWVKDGKAYLTDRYAEGEYMPTIDEHNDYHLISGQEINGTTILKFSRKIDTCDKKDRKLTEGSTKVIFALNDVDPESPTKMSKHTYRGARSILLLSAHENKNKPDPSWKSFDILNNKTSISSSKDTTYHCSMHKIPEFKEKNHIVRFDPVIQPGNEGIVHHTLVYACDKTFPEHHGNVSIDCDDKANMPFEVRKCRGLGILVGGWAIGGGPFIYPNHVGFPIGTDMMGSHFVLEVHYDNPDLKSNIIDSSGIRYFYTSALRKNDAGVMTVGKAVSPWDMVPPKQKAWKTTGACSKQVTEKHLQISTLPEKGIKIFASLLHTHLSGRALWTKHVRNGVELPEIARDDNYDFNFQDFHALQKEIHIKPGDDIVHTCVYNTMDRTKPTFGGQKTTDEMCFNFIYYYPYLPDMPLYCNGINLNAGVGLVDKYYSSVGSNASIKNNPIVSSDKLWTQEMSQDYRKMIDEEKSEMIQPWLFRSSNITIRELMKEKYQSLKVKITTPLPAPKDNCSNTDIDSAAATNMVHVLYPLVTALCVIALIG